MNILQSVERYSFYSFNITIYISEDKLHYQRNSIRFIWNCRVKTHLSWVAYLCGVWVAITELWLLRRLRASFGGLLNMVIFAVKRHFHLLRWCSFASFSGSLRREIWGIFVFQEFD